MQYFFEKKWFSNSRQTPGVGMTILMIKKTRGRIYVSAWISLIVGLDVAQINLNKRGSLGQIEEL